MDLFDEGDFESSCRRGFHTVRIPCSCYHKAREFIIQAINDIADGHTTETDADEDNDDDEEEVEEDTVSNESMPTPAVRKTLQQKLAERRDVQFKGDIQSLFSESEKLSCVLKMREAFMQGKEEAEVEDEEDEEESLQAEASSHELLQARQAELTRRVLQEQARHAKLQQELQHEHQEQKEMYQTFFDEIERYKHLEDVLQDADGPEFLDSRVDQGEMAGGGSVQLGDVPSTEMLACNWENDLPTALKTMRLPAMPPQNQGLRPQNIASRRRESSGLNGLCRERRNIEGNSRSSEYGCTSFSLVKGGGRTDEDDVNDSEKQDIVSQFFSRAIDPQLLTGMTRRT